MLLTKDSWDVSITLMLCRSDGVKRDLWVSVSVPVNYQQQLAIASQPGLSGPLWSREGYVRLFGPTTPPRRDRRTLFTTSSICDWSVRYKE